jgi:hypothetical protein
MDASEPGSNAAVESARIQVRSADARLTLVAPRARPTSWVISFVVVIGILFAIPAFCAIGLHGSPLGAMAVTSPFWIVGLVLLGRHVLPLFQVTSLELTRDGGTISTAPLGKARRLKIEDVRIRTGHWPDFQSPEDAAQGAQPAVLLDHGKETHAFLIGFDPRHQKRVIEVLQAWLARIQSK